MEHLDGLRLVAVAIAQEPAELLLSLALGLRLAGLFERLGPALRGEESGQIRKLSGLHRDQLIAGLGRLQDADGRLTARKQRTRLRLSVGQVLHRAGAEGERMLEGGQRILPALLRASDHLLIAGRGADRDWVALRESLIQ
jgi:hypothetical protein